MKDSDDKFLSGIYETLGGPGSFGSAKALFLEAKRRGSKLNLSQVKQWASRFKSESLFREKPRRPLKVFAMAKSHKWSLDLAFYPPYNKIIGFLIW